MKFITSLLTAATFATSALAVSNPDLNQNSIRDALNQIEERATATFAIQGANGLGDNQIHPRLEIDTLYYNNTNQWTLFILAMQKFKAIDQSNMTSFYQIAGIHGVPHQNWDNVNQCSSCGDADGYCPHNSILFPPWHRVYMALIEQQLIKNALDVANSYPAGAQRTAMLQAQSTLRFPYWDWAATPNFGGPTVPTTITNQTLTVNGPTGVVIINNPLYSHTFQDTSNLYYYPFVQWPSTLRWPDTDDSDAVSQESQMISAFDNIRSNLKDQVYQLLSTCADYNHFSNTAASGSSKCSNSLEGIHNTIHVTAGGPGSDDVSSGHMSYLSEAAFDPMFFLHHMNVDRLFALWQTVNPNSYGGSQTAQGDTWTIAQGSTQGNNSPLTPFHSDTKGTFWTPAKVRTWNTTFKYTYPEFSNSAGTKAAIVSLVAQLYGKSSTRTAGTVKRNAAANPALVGGVVSAVAGAASSAAVAAPSYAAGLLNSTTSLLNSTLGDLLDPFTAANGSTYEYVANIVTPRYALKSSYSIFLFNGSPATEDPSCYYTDSNLIGPMGVLAGSDMVMSETMLISGSVPLTTFLQGLVHDGTLPDMREEHCVPYLTKNLQWRIVKGNTEIAPTSLPGFEVSVFSSSSSPLSLLSLPQWSEFVPQVQITAQKPGGATVPKWDDDGDDSGSGKDHPVSTVPAIEDATVTATRYSTTTVCPCATSAAAY